MKSRLLFWTVGLVLVVVAASCAPAETILPAPSATESAPVAAPADTSAPEAAAADPTQAVDVQAVPASRGPDLHATDPSTVSLASGGLQLVEFFRFT
jgi:hypothetical protein